MKLKFWIGVLASIGLLVFLFFTLKIDIPKLWATMKSVDPYYLTAAAIANIVFYYIRAVRWRYLMDPIKKDVPVGSLFSAVMVGFMANNILPARIGEFIRAYVLGRREKVTASSVFGTVVAERLVDGLSIMLLLIAVLAFLPADIAGGEFAQGIRRFGEISMGLYLVVIIMLAWFLFHPHSLTSAVRAVLSPVSGWLAEKAAYMANSFIVGLGALKNARLLLFIAFYSALHWGLLFIPNWLLFKAFGLGDGYGVYAATLVLLAMVVGVAVPGTPGAVGPFEAATVGALTLLGTGGEKALGFAIVAHAAGFIPTTLVGFFCLYRENLSISGIRKAEVGAQT